jgi:hypothetical protein
MELTWRYGMAPQIGPEFSTRPPGQSPWQVSNDTESVQSKMLTPIPGVAYNKT